MMEVHGPDQHHAFAMYIRMLRVFGTKCAMCTFTYQVTSLL